MMGSRYERKGSLAAKSSRGARSDIPQIPADTPEEDWKNERIDYISLSAHNFGTTKGDRELADVTADTKHVFISNGLPHFEMLEAIIERAARGVTIALSPSGFKRTRKMLALRQLLLTHEFRLVPVGRSACSGRRGENKKLHRMLNKADVPLIPMDAPQEDWDSMGRAYKTVTMYLAIDVDDAVSHLEADDKYVHIAGTGSVEMIQKILDRAVACEAIRVVPSIFKNMCRSPVIRELLHERGCALVPGRKVLLDELKDPPRSRILEEADVDCVEVSVDGYRINPMESLEPVTTETRLVRLKGGGTPSKALIVAILDLAAPGVVVQMAPAVFNRCCNKPAFRRLMALRGLVLEAGDRLPVGAKPGSERKPRR